MNWPKVPFKIGKLLICSFVCFSYCSVVVWWYVLHTDGPKETPDFFLLVGTAIKTDVAIRTQQKTSHFFTGQSIPIKTLYIKSTMETSLLALICFKQEFVFRSVRLQIKVNRSCVNQLVR